MQTLEQDVERFLAAWMHIRQVVQAANFNRFHQAGLSATQFMTLNVVPEGGATLTQLARRLNLSAASLNQTVNSLEERGLVKRTEDRSDARKRTIVSTAKGKRLQNAASGEFHRFLASLFETMPENERKGLLTGLERLVHLTAATETPNFREGGVVREERNARQSRQQQSE